MRLELEGKLKDRFKFLMSHYEQKTNVGLLKLLIILKYDEVEKEKLRYSVKKQQPKRDR